MNNNSNPYPKPVQFQTHDGSGFTDEAKAWLERIRTEVKLSMLAENVLRIEYPTDLVAQVRTVNVDDCIFRLDLYDPGDRFHLCHCIFPDVPWNNRLFMLGRWPKQKRTEEPGVVTLTFPAQGLHPGDVLETFPKNKPMI